MLGRNQRRAAGPSPPFGARLLVVQLRSQRTDQRVRVGTNHSRCDGLIADVRAVPGVYGRGMSVRLVQALLVVVVLAAVAPPSADAFLTFSRTDFATGTAPSAVVATVARPGDENGLYPMLLVANGGSDNVTVLVGDGDGDLVSAPSVGAGSQPAAIAAADLDADVDANHYTDIAVANRGVPDTVTVRFGSGGGFSAATVLGAAQGIGSDPSGIAADDFNGDGFADLAVANSGDDTVTILLGDGDGGFAKTAASPIAVGDEPVAIEWGWDGLYVVNRAGGTVSQITDPAGTSPTVTPWSAGIGSQPVGLATRMDRAPFPKTDVIAVVNYGSGTGTLLTKAFGLAQLPGSPFQVGSTPTGVTGGPFGGNFVPINDPVFHASGLSDYAFTNEATDSVTFLIQDVTSRDESDVFHAGSGTLNTGDKPAAISQYDLNGDGNDGDIAVANAGSNTVSVFINLRQPQLTRTPAALNFAAQPKSTLSDAQDVTLTNTGGVQVRVNTVEVTGPNPQDFVVSSDGCRGRQLLAGFNDTCTIRVRFAPTATGARTATLRIVDENSVIRTTTLSGTGDEVATGPAGPSGAIGAAGPPGPQGPAGTSSAVVKLYAGIAEDPLTAKAKRRFRVRYVLTRSALVTIDVLKGAKRRQRIKQNAPAGRGSVLVTALKPGKYTLKLTARSSDAQVTTDKVTLKVT